MSSEESSSQDQENDSDQEQVSNPKSPENNETNSVTNESTERVKNKDNKLLGKKTERDGKKTNHDYCSSCLKKGKLLLCEDCERSYHKKCLKLEEKDISTNKKEINKKDKEKDKEKEKINKKNVKENKKEVNKNKDESEEEYEEEDEEKEEMEVEDDKEEKEEQNETEEKNESKESNNEEEENKNSNESNENEENNDSNENQEEEEKENTKKKKGKKKGKKPAKKIEKPTKKNSGDKNDKTEKKEKEKTKEKEKEKTPDKTKKEKTEKKPIKDNKDKFTVTTVRSKRLQEKQKQKEKLEKEKLEKEKEKEKEKKDKTPEKDKNSKLPKKKAGGKAKKGSDKSDNENKISSSNSNDEEIYTEDNNNANIKSELLSFLKKLTIKEVKNNTLEKLNIPENISNSLKDEAGLKKLTSLMSNDKSFNKYKNIWNALIDKISFPSEKQPHQKIIHYPIRCKELYSNPELHNLEQKYMQKTDGILYPYFNGKTFNRVVGIYDFLSTFANKIYLDKFTLEEFYSALLKSETYTKSEINLLSSIHVSLCYLLIEELLEYPIQDLYSNGEKELLMVKEVVEYKREDLNKVYAFIYYSWPELVRLFLKSKTFSKDISIEVTYELLPVLEKIYKCKDVISYNTSLNFEDKLLILENLVVISYETNFVREIVKEANDVLNKYKKQKRDLEEELKYLDSRKTEFERHNKLTQPQNRIDEINQKLSELGPNKTRSADNKMRLKLENEKQILEDMIREMGENNVLREDNMTKLKEIKQEIFEVQTIGRTNLGIDGRGYKYFYFNWMPNVIFMRAKNKYLEEKYEWRMINDLDTLNNDLIDKLSDKGIEELDLKSNLEIIYKKLTDKGKETESKGSKIIMDEENFYESNKEKEKKEGKEKEKSDDKGEKEDEDVVMKNENDKDTKEEKEKEEKDTNNKIKKETNEKKEKEEFIPQSLDYIFDNQVLKYENSLNPNINISGTGANKQNKIILITSETNQYEPICDRIKKLEINMTKYLVLDNRQWESQANRAKIKLWISTINSLQNFINILLFFHERIKIPYKSETLSFADFIFGKSATRKIIEEEKEEDESEGEIKNKSCPLIVNGNLDYNYINRDLTYANRIKLWTKEFETFNIEKIYLEYLKNVKSISQLLICLNLFEMMIIELNKRRDMCKRKGDNFIPEIVKNDENKNNGENSKDNFNKIVIKKPDVKKRKLIQWNVKCMYCHEFGELLCCEECPNVAHLACAKLTKLPDAWKCSFCVDNMKI